MQTTPKRPPRPSVPDVPTVEQRPAIRFMRLCDECETVAHCTQHGCIPFAKPTSMRSWWLEFDDDGAPVNWTGTAASEADAEAIARLQLATKHADFDRYGARLVACLER